MRLDGHADFDPDRSAAGLRSSQQSDPDSRRAAGFRLLRDNLLAKPTPRIIAVSSGAADEGKTTCAINLAFAMCEQPLRILLLDGNFSAPLLGEIFDIDASTPAVPSMDPPWLSPYESQRSSAAFTLRLSFGIAGRLHPRSTAAGSTW